VKYEEIKCPVCFGSATLLDVVDFNKNCEEIRGKFLPLSGNAIYYSRCNECLFTFAPEFQEWPENLFLDKIYNAEYIQVDPDYLEARPQSNFLLLKKLFSKDRENIAHLDYGGGNGKLSHLLKEDGWNSRTYDPFPALDLNVQKLGKFNLITAFEVFEHVPDVNMLMDNLTELIGDDGLILFSTLVSDGHIEKNSRLSWWYASPRNGHISLFSRKSLLTLGTKYKLNFGGFNDGLHCFYKQMPSWAKYLIK
jgi:hypothetical protein